MKAKTVSTMPDNGRLFKFIIGISLGECMSLNFKRNELRVKGVFNEMLIFLFIKKISFYVFYISIEM